MAVAEQWGAVVTMTDVTQLTIRHKPLQKAIQLLGIQSAETVEREIYNVLVAGTSIYFPGTVTARDALTTTSFMNADTIRRVVANLRSNGALGLERGNTQDPELGDIFVAVVDPFVEMDVTTDPDFIDAVKYSSSVKLWNGEIGKFMGVRFVRSNSLPTITSAAFTGASANEGGGDLPEASARYSRWLVVGYDTTFNYASRVFQAQAIDAGTTGTDDDSVTVTLPSDSAYTYKIFAAFGGSAPAATATKYQQAAAAGFIAPSAVIEIGDSGNANGTTIFAHVTSGTEAGSILSELDTASSKTHVSFFIGKEAYTVVDLANLQATLTPPVPSDSDPLMQRRKAGWKVFFKSVINNNDYFARVESESNFD